MPHAVYEETQASLQLTAAGRVPNLDEFEWIETITLADSDIASAGAELIGTRRSTQTYSWFGRQIDRPEIEAIILAQRIPGHVVLEDRKGVNCARKFGVEVTNVADLLVELQQQQLIGDAGPYAEDILATGYYSKELRWLAWTHSFKKSRSL